MESGVSKHYSNISLLHNTGYAKHELILFVLAALLITGCGREKPDTSYVARVNDSYLNEAGLNHLMASEQNRNLYRNEIIRNWINRELLYQQAGKDGILKSGEYKQLLDNAEKELAASLLVKKNIAEGKISFEPKELEDYYAFHKNDFRLFYNMFLLNRIRFNNEDDAIRFRTTVLESDWTKALNVFKGDSSIVSEQENQGIYEYELTPGMLQRIVKELNPQEISIILSDSLNNYFMVQVIDKFNAGTIPPFKVIRPWVEERLFAEKKERLIKEYIKELYSENDIEVKN